MPAQDIGSGGSGRAPSGGGSAEMPVRKKQTARRFALASTPSAAAAPAPSSAGLWVYVIDTSEAARSEDFVPNRARYALGSIRTLSKAALSLPHAPDDAAVVVAAHAPRVLVPPGAEDGGLLFADPAMADPAACGDEFRLLPALRLALLLCRQRSSSSGSGTDGAATASTSTWTPAPAPGMGGRVVVFICSGATVSEADVAAASAAFAACPVSVGLDLVLLGGAAQEVPSESMAHMQALVDTINGPSRDTADSTSPSAATVGFAAARIQPSLSPPLARLVRFDAPDPDLPCWQQMEPLLELLELPTGGGELAAVAGEPMTPIPSSSAFRRAGGPAMGPLGNRPFPLGQQGGARLASRLRQRLMGPALFSSRALRPCNCRHESLDSLHHLSHDGFMHPWLPSYANPARILAPMASTVQARVMAILYNAGQPWRVLYSLPAGLVVRCETGGSGGSSGVGGIASSSNVSDGNEGPLPAAASRSSSNSGSSEDTRSGEQQVTTEANSSMPGSGLDASSSSKGTTAAVTADASAGGKARYTPDSRRGTVMLAWRLDDSRTRLRLLWTPDNPTSGTASTTTGACNPQPTEVSLASSSSAASAPSAVAAAVGAGAVLAATAASAAAAAVAAAAAPSIWEAPSAALVKDPCLDAEVMWDLLPGTTRFSEYSHPSGGSRGQMLLVRGVTPVAARAAAPAALAPGGGGSGGGAATAAVPAPSHHAFFWLQAAPSSSGRKAAAAAGAARAAAQALQTLTDSPPQPLSPAAAAAVVAQLQQVAGFPGALTALVQAGLTARSSAAPSTADQRPGDAAAPTINSASGAAAGASATAAAAAAAQHPSGVVRPPAEAGSAYRASLRFLRRASEPGSSNYFLPGSPVASAASRPSTAGVAAPGTPTTPGGAARIAAVGESSFQGTPDAGAVPPRETLGWPVYSPADALLRGASSGSSSSETPIHRTRGAGRWAAAGGVGLAPGAAGSGASVRRVSLEALLLRQRAVQQAFKAGEAAPRPSAAVFVSTPGEAPGNAAFSRTASSGSSVSEDSSVVLPFADSGTLSRNAMGNSTEDAHVTRRDPTAMTPVPLPALLPRPLLPYPHNTRGAAGASPGVPLAPPRRMLICQPAAQPLEPRMSSSAPCASPIALSSAIDETAEASARGRGVAACGSTIKPAVVAAQPSLADASANVSNAVPGSPPSEEDALTAAGSHTGESVVVAATPGAAGEAAADAAAAPLLPAIAPAPGDAASASATALDEPPLLFELD